MVKKNSRPASYFLDCTRGLQRCPRFARSTASPSAATLKWSPPLGRAVMKIVLQARHMLTCIVAGDANRANGGIVDYHHTEGTILSVEFVRRLRVTNDQRRRFPKKSSLAAQNRRSAILRAAAQTVSTIVSPCNKSADCCQYTGFRDSGGILPSGSAPILLTRLRRIPLSTTWSTSAKLRKRRAGALGHVDGAASRALLKESFPSHAQSSLTGLSLGGETRRLG
jgi:hypothetical protein